MATTWTPTTDVLDRLPHDVEAHPRTHSRATWLIEATWLFLLAALPTALNPWGALAFEPLKASLLRAAAALVLAAWLVRRRMHAPLVDVGAQPVARAAVVFVALAALSTATSVEPWLSFSGNFDRGTGWLSLAAAATLMLAAADVFADASCRERAITALVLGAVIPCAYFLVQHSGRDPLVWTALGAPGSTMGSPTLLGGYLVLVAPFALYRVIGSARTNPTAYAGWLALLLIVCGVTVLTTIRGAMLGVGVGLVTFALLAFHGWRVRIALALGVVAVVIALAVAAGGTSGLTRFMSISRTGDLSIERLTVWRDSLSLPLVHPARALLGFGPDTQQASLEHAEATVRLTENQQWDRAHNFLLDTWLSQGAAGVAALVVLVGAACLSAWRARSAGSLLPPALLAAIAGHLVEQAFAFESVTSSLIFWLVLGLAASRAPRVAGRRPPRLVVRAGVVAAIVAVPLLVMPAVADFLYGQAGRGDALGRAQREDQAAALAPWAEELPRAAALDWQRSPDARSQVEADLLSAAARAPAEPFPQLRLVRWYLLQADATSASERCDRALELGPYRVAIWQACADVSIALGQTDVAQARRVRAEELRQPLSTP